MAFYEGGRVYGKVSRSRRAGGPSFSAPKFRIVQRNISGDAAARSRARLQFAGKRASVAVAGLTLHHPQASVA